MIKRIVIAGGLSALAAAAQNCDSLCKEPAAPTASRVYRVDASKTGQTYSDKLDDKDTAALYVFNKNPFKYEYKITKDVRDLTQDIIRSFIGVIPGFGSLPTSSFFGAAAAGASEFDSAPQEVKDAWKKLSDKAEEVKKLVKEAEDDLKARDAARQKYNAFVELTAPDVLTDCSDVCAKATELKPLMTQLTELKPARDRQAKIEKGMKDLDDLLKALKDLIDKPGNTDSNKDAEKKVATNTVDDAKKGQTTLDAYKKALDTLESQKDPIGKLANVLRGSNWSYFDTQTETSSGSSRNVRWTVLRRDLRTSGAGWEQLAVVSLDMGSAPVSISVGAVISAVDFQKFVRQASTDGKGGVVSKFGRESTGSFSYGGGAQLNGHVYSRKGVTVGASLGFTVATNGDTIEPGLLFGPAFGFRNKTVWLTPALNVTRVSQLGGGFNVGDPIPANLQDPLPIEKHAKVGFVFSLTYKIR